MREFDQEAQRFFSATGPTIASPSLAPGPSPFDLSALHGVLPANQAGVQAPPGPLAAWASDFLHQQQQQHHAPPASQAALISNAARQESGLGVGAPAIVGGMPAREYQLDPRRSSFLTVLACSRCAPVGDARYVGHACA
jgi:hypothetical protein